MRSTIINVNDFHRKIEERRQERKSLKKNSDAYIIRHFNGVVVSRMTPLFNDCLYTQNLELQNDGTHRFEVVFPASCFKSFMNPLEAEEYFTHSTFYSIPSHYTPFIKGSHVYESLFRTFVDDVTSAGFIVDSIYARHAESLETFQACITFIIPRKED